MVAVLERRHVQLERLQVAHQDLGMSQRPQGGLGLEIPLAAVARDGPPRLPLLLRGEVVLRMLLSVAAVRAAAMLELPPAPAAPATQDQVAGQTAYLRQRRPGGAGRTIAVRPGLRGE